MFSAFQLPEYPLNLVENERTKLLANALDRASTACIAVGLIAPMVVILGQPLSDFAMSWTDAKGSVIWLFAAIVLHMAGRRVLGGLRP